MAYLGQNVTLVVLSSCMVEETHLKNNVRQRFHPLPLPFGLIQVGNPANPAMHIKVGHQHQAKHPGSMGHGKENMANIQVACSFRCSLLITHPHVLHTWAAQLDIALSIPWRCLLHVPRHPLRRPVGCTGQHPSQVGVRYWDSTSHLSSCLRKHLLKLDPGKLPWQCSINNQITVSNNKPSSKRNRNCSRLQSNLRSFYATFQCCRGICTCLAALEQFFPVIHFQLRGSLKVVILLLHTCNKWFRISIMVVQLTCSF